MAAEPSSDLPNGTPAAATDRKKSRESDRRRRRRKQKKNKAPSDAAADAAADVADAAEDDDKPDSKPPVRLLAPLPRVCTGSISACLPRLGSDAGLCRARLQVEIEVEYVAEEPDLADGLLADFKSIFEKFTFKDTPAAAEVSQIQSTPLFGLILGAKPYEICSPAALQWNRCSLVCKFACRMGRRRTRLAPTRRRRGRGPIPTTTSRMPSRRRRKAASPIRRRRFVFCLLSVCCSVIG
jgi:hypothetical protein